MTKFANITVSLQAEIDSAKIRIEDWSKSFSDNPVYAFEFSDEAFLDVARVQVFEIVINMINKGATLDSLISFINSNVRNSALRPARSTSVQANTIAQNKGIAWAELADKFQYVEK
jgi:hypothetical protein